MKKVRAVIIVGLIFVIILFCCGIIYRSFDPQEAAEALGETYELTEGWILEEQDGTSKTIELPYTVSHEDVLSLTLQKTLTEDYAGLALSFYAENAAVRVFIDGKPIYEAGYSDGEANEEALPFQEFRLNNPGVEQPNGQEPGIEQPNGQEPGGEQPDGLQPPQEMVQPRGERKTAAGEILMDLPNNLNNNSILIIYLERVNNQQSIVIHGASVAKRDVSVLGLMRSAVFPLICCLIIIMTTVVLVMLDVLRRLWHQRTRGLYLMAFFAVDSIIYSFIRTDILVAFFGNKIFFGIMESMCYILMPVILVMFFGRGFRSHFPKRFPVLLFLTVAIAFGELLLGFAFNVRLSEMSLFTFFVQLFAIGAIAEMLLEWNRTRPKHGKVWLDLLALACLTVSVLVNPIQDYVQDFWGLDFLKNSTITAFFVLIMLQHTQIILEEYQERMEEQTKIAVAANEAKGRFLANMSHEIRTPINAVLGMDEMILRESKEKEIRGYAADIYSAGQTLLALINDILDFSKIESGKMEIVPVDYDLSSLIHDLVNMISMRAKNKDLDFQVSASPELPSRMFGDDVRIRQVLTNILTNAVKYTETGSVWFRISGKMEGENEVLRFEVEDTGIGIKEEDMPKLFEEFERIEEERNRSIEGTGLGMNITIQLLSLMNSRLRVESTYGKGSKFWFELYQPITDHNPIGDLESRIQNLTENYTYEKQFVAPEAKILVVDDNAMNRKVFRSLLKPTQVQIEEASGGQECLSLVQSREFHLIFLDHMMPEMDGVETLQRIRELTDYPSKGAQVIALTANAVAGARENYLSLGFDGFLSKPVAADKLEEAVREYLPKELIESVPEGEGDDWAEESAMPEDLPVIDGLDWYIAWLHLPDPELMKETLENFYDLLPIHGKKLSEMYERLPEEQAFTDYRIQVHGMKSAAALVGIIPLAGMAKILEFAARDKNLDTIRAMHDIYMREWDSYREKLRGIFGIGENAEEADPEDPNVTKALLMILSSAMEEMDIDTADETMKKLLSYQYSEERKKRMTDLKAAVTDLDSELAGEIIAELENG